LLVDPTRPDAIAAALRRVVGERGLAADLRARGLARAGELSWRRFAEANVAIYREMLG
jgi:glycosyltransferase involved in cell wall biosynthesis